MRDVAILWGLHVARALTAVQVAVELFPGQQVVKARNQLNRLRGLGLVERHRGGRVRGSDAYLWTMTSKGFKALQEAWLRSLGDGMVPLAWSTIRLGAFVEWGWKDQIWGTELPGRVKHDLQTIDFLISYRRCIDAELAKLTGGRCATVTEWRCEHAFMAQWEKGTRYREGGPMGLNKACREAFPESDQWNSDSGLHIDQSGFADDCMRVVKPDGAVSIIIDQLPDGIDCKPLLSEHSIRPRHRKACPEPQVTIDVLVEFDRTGKGSANIEKLRCLDLFLNIGRHAVKSNPIHCLRHSEWETKRRGDQDEGYTPDVFVLFVCPPGKLRSIMTAADQTLTGHLLSQDRTVPLHIDNTWLYNYEARRRIIFCEANSFGNITADLYDHERWLRLPAHRRPAPPAPRTADLKMWRLPGLPPRSAIREHHRAPVRDAETFKPIPWEWPAMIEYTSHEAPEDPEDDGEPYYECAG